MSIVSELSLAGAIGRKGKIKGSITTDNSVRGSLSSKAYLTGRVAAGNTLEDPTQTFILVDEDGYEIPAVFVDEEIEITATANDIRLGTTAVTGDGVVDGTKFIPTYITVEGYRQIASGASFEIPYLHESDIYDFTKMQAIICVYTGDPYTSVQSDRVVINEKVYPVMSEEVLSEVIRDRDNKKIKLGIVNNSDNKYFIRYFIYKEVY